MGLLEARANLEGKTAIVIGGAGGNGCAVTRDLLEAGVKVAFCDMDAEALDQIRQELPEEEGVLAAELVDAREPDQLTRFLEQFDALGEQLDILVNVAGGTKFKMFADTTPADWEVDAHWNFLYQLQTMRFAVERMKATGGGSIVNVTTIEAHRGAPGYAVYAGLKAGLHNFTRSLATEVGRDGIRVNTIAIESVVTASQAKIRKVEFAEAERTEELVQAGFEMYVPLGRIGTVEELSNAVLFLASDLSSFVTGSSVHVDGGGFASPGWYLWPDGQLFPRPSPGALERLYPPSGSDPRSA